MKILIISVITPFPIDTGGNAGTFKLIEHARKGNDITFISLPCEKSKIEGLKKMWPNVTILTKVSQQNEPTLKEKLKQGVKEFLQKKNDSPANKLLLNRTNLVAGFYEEFVKEVIEVSKNNQFDLIQVEYIELAPIVYFLPKNIPTVFIHHELRYRRMEYEYGLMEKQSLNDLWKIHTTKELEIGLMNRYDSVLTVSEDDKTYLIQSGVKAEKVAYSPSPVEILDRATNVPFKFKNKIVYLGPEAHYPNEDGVRWFLNECWPEVSNQFPEIDFQIVGKWSDDTIASMPSNDRVKFLGFVDSLQDVFEGAILVVPLRIGGGMRMKILEAISWNTPIITTSIGAEGLPMVHEENCFIADSAAEFINALKSIKSLGGKVSEMMHTSKKDLGSKFSIETCGKRREELYAELVNN
jgi:glycosyltransferase involved in cell wall biosynthesis